MGYIPAPFAMLENTHALEAGSWIEVAPGAFRRGRFFDFPRDPEPALRGGDAAEALDAAIDRAVRRHLASDVPVGVFLSGGVDSPLVASAMRAAHDSPISAFTIGLTDDAMDESPEAAAYAHELNLSHQVEIADPQKVHDLVPEAVQACSEPFADESIFPTLLVSRLARSEVKVVLSGDGGDELFWGYAGRFGSVLRQAHYFAEPQVKRSLRYFLDRASGRNGIGYNVRRASIGAWYRAKHSAIAEPDLRGIFPDLPGWPEEYRAFEHEGAGLDQTAAWMRWNEFNAHLSMVLLKVDRASMFHSLEVRVPLLDREVLAVALRVDWRECLDPEKNIGKLLLRASLARRCRRQTIGKRGFSVPLGRWFRGPLRGLLEDSVLGRREVAGLPFHAGRLRRYFEKHLAGEADFGSGIWNLLSLALWQETHCNRMRRDGAPEPERYAVRVG
jgi:asparagine synthase (glutamine-hydrolysing)